MPARKNRPDKYRGKVVEEIQCGFSGCGLSEWEHESMPYHPHLEDHIFQPETDDQRHARQEWEAQLQEMFHKSLAVFFED